MLERLMVFARGMNNRFPEGNEPYQIMTRLLEECGEVAAEVNHFENSGTKALRRGEPSKEKLAGEIKDALNALMQLVLYYRVEGELEAAIEKGIQRLTEEGCIGRGERSKTQNGVTDEKSDGERYDKVEDGIMEDGTNE